MLTLLKPPAETYAWSQVAMAPVMGFPPQRAGGEELKT